jgi:hypothetical protein
MSTKIAPAKMNAVAPHVRFDETQLETCAAWFCRMGL